MKKIFLAFIFLIALCSCSVAADNEDISRKLANLERQVEHLQKSVNDLSIQLSKSDSERSVEHRDLRNRSFDYVSRFGMTITAIFIGMPVLLMFLRWYHETKDDKHMYLTREDVERIICLMLDAKFAEIRKKGKLNNAV